ncbi:MAG: adenylyltransferase/cytidyltransferase family protein [Acholeplasmatales bacterium]|nr:adenylyltransferase/cytidyltransferase family protein [Acholeplasmatales bacterium]
MKKVITYGSYDHLHQGHINLLKRAKELGDFLIVGVTSENFDIIRGKINTDQSLIERMKAVEDLGIADLVIPEEYEGQKIDDIKRYGVDIFAIGSDWTGYFDYLKEYCTVTYLPRTEGISSTMLRSKNVLRIGIAGSDPSMLKLKRESKFVNGCAVNDIYLTNKFDKVINDLNKVNSFDDLLKNNDAIYLACKTSEKYDYAMRAMREGKHLIIDTPIADSYEKANEILNYAEEHNLKVFDSIKTAYALAFERLILLVKAGKIGSVSSIDATCTSLEMYDWLKDTNFATSFTAWGPFGLLPVFKILGLNYTDYRFDTIDNSEMKDIFTKLTLRYPNAVANVNVGVGVKSESDLRICGTKGFIYIPSPWWKTDYFEMRFEDAQNNKRYFYKLDGEGIRMELVEFIHSVIKDRPNFNIERDITLGIAKMIENYSNK